MKAKYVIVRSMGLDNAILFSPIINHSEMKQLGMPIVSAGQCSITDDWQHPDGEDPLIQCYGESVTLKLKSRGEEDAKVIVRNFD